MARTGTLRMRTNTLKHQLGHDSSWLHKGQSGLVLVDTRLFEFMKNKIRIARKKGFYQMQFRERVQQSVLALVAGAILTILKNVIFQYLF